MKDDYNPYVKLLLLPYSNEKVVVQYNWEDTFIEIPQIGPRPPYYANPRYEQYYPII
ncbi:hypothetical protein P5G51_002910 [Virgibacillus sp. 179-BFC.A HS]|uniref:Uncharacterized protein n=1 Tax=Tigheibacillus jepli TaxID=3035914 RepID=A0ABU5CDT0_9BACI|nr:hypothetical protein [Virgibacillus sp. 179-BFC.A HS]MDY0404497.1 hypothetical protein [Virgibacillus sp. 179-BFC.A HS]